MRKRSVVAAIMAAAIGLSYCEGWRHATSKAHEAVATHQVSAPPASADAAGARAANVARAAELARAIAIGDAARASAAQASGAQASGARASVAAVETVAGDTGSGKGSGVPSVFGQHWADGKFAAFSPEELAEMATRCELRWQLPRTPDARYVTALRALYVELTGDPNGAAAQDAGALADFLRRHGDEDAGAAQARLASARAGDAVAHTGSVYERFLQLQLDESERAHADGAEGGAKFTLSGCDPASSVFRSTR